MAITIISPAASFVQFGGAESPPHCVYGNVDYCLPVLEEDDVHFQFILKAETEEEADAICDAGNIIFIGLADDCAYASTLIIFDEKPERFRISPTKILYNWKHGFPGFAGEIPVDGCFRVQISFSLDGEDYNFCSNCFQRISDGCFTSVLEYGNEENAFGFNYCAAGEDDDETAVDCLATYITFPPGTETLVIPYTASMQAKYGDAPTIQTWIYDEDGNLVNMGITAKLDGFPPTQLEFDFGGPAAGVIVIK